MNLTEVLELTFGIKENADVSLHDCRTNRVQCEEQFIRFFIPGGFYVIHDEKRPDTAENRNAEVTCRFMDRYEDRFQVTVYRKNLWGRIVRRDWTDEFAAAVNSGKVEFEFVTTYRAYHNVLFKGYIWRHRRPWWRECEIDLMTDEITYTWEEREAEDEQ